MRAYRQAPKVPEQPFDGDMLEDPSVVDNENGGFDGDKLEDPSVVDNENGGFDGDMREELDVLDNEDGGDGMRQYRRAPGVPETADGGNHKFKEINADDENNFEKV